MDEPGKCSNSVLVGSFFLALHAAPRHLVVAVELQLWCQYGRQAVSQMYLENKEALSPARLLCSYSKANEE